jgi:sn1-specific diacylglycerol lipase
MPFEPAWAHPVSSDTSPHLVHSGMYLLAQLMGSPRQPVHAAVRSALLKHPGYELILCGHSLGAGLAAMLALVSDFLVNIVHVGLTRW